MNPIHRMKNHSRLLNPSIAAMIATVTLFAGYPSTATAQESKPASVDTLGYDSQMDQMQNSFSSVAAAMSAYYAANRGQALGAYLAGNPNSLARLSGANNSGNLNTLLSQAAAMKNPSELDALMIQNGVGLDVNSWSTLGNAAADLKSKSQSIDAAVVNAGMSWASALTSLNVPAVNNPGFPALETTLGTSMPAEGLAFGLFLNRSLANLISNFPDVFSQVRQTGVASPNANEAWKSAMTQAGGASYTQMRNVVGTSACGTAFVDGLVGNSSGGCSPCSVAGLYGNAQLQLALGGGTNPVTGVENLATQSPQTRSNAVNANPVVSASVDDVLAGNLTGCSAASGAVVSGASRVLPNVVRYLTTK